MSIRNRYLALLALRWLPIGLLAPLLVLIIRRGGLSLSEAGVVLATYGVTTAAMELPTGGVADALGRRNVLVVSAAVSLGFVVMLLVASSLAGFVFAAVLGGVSRALDSGPLESWFVDRLHESGLGADIRGGLAAGGVTDGLSLALGAIAGGLLPVWFAGSFRPVIWASIVAGTIYMLAIPLLMTGEPHLKLPSIGAAMSDARRAVTTGVKTAVINRSVRLLFIAALTMGLGVTAVELLWQPRFVALIGTGSEATGPLGFILAGGFAMAATGSALAPWLTRKLGSDPRRAAFFARLLNGLILATLALMSSVLPAAVFFVLFYMMNGLSSPVSNELLHDQVSKDVRSTMLSVKSLTLQVGGVVGSLGAGRLADAGGIPTAWLVAAAVLVAGAFTFLRVEWSPGSKRESHPEPAFGD